MSFAAMAHCPSCTKGARRSCCEGPSALFACCSIRLGMGPRIVNYHEWRGHTVSVLQQQIQTRPAPSIEALLAEIKSYRAPSGSRMPAMADGSLCYATPLQIATRLSVFCSPAGAHSSAICRLRSSGSRSFRRALYCSASLSGFISQFLSILPAIGAHRSSRSNNRVIPMTTNAIDDVAGQKRRSIAAGPPQSAGCMLRPA